MKNILRTSISGIFASLLLFANVQAQDCFSPSNPGSCYTPYDDSGCANRYWFEADYLYWQVKRADDPTPFVVANDSLISGDVLDQEGSHTVLGGDHLKSKWRSGGKFALGYWFDDCRTWGAEANYFFLPQNSRTHGVFSNGLAGSDYLYIPFFDTSIDAENSVVIANPSVNGHNAFSGAARLKSSNRMQGAELNAIAGGWLKDCDYNVDLLAGFRYWNFNEDLTFSTNSPYLNNDFNNRFLQDRTDIFTTSDQFKVDNNFYGAQVGFNATTTWNCFFLNLKAKVALGGIVKNIKTRGRLVTNDFDRFNDPQIFDGGYFVQYPRKHTNTKFSVLPEVNLNVGYQVMDGCKIQVGYTFLYVSNVLRAGRVVNRDINSAASNAISDLPVVSAERNNRCGRSSDGIWAQGVNVGFTFEF